MKFLMWSCTETWSANYYLYCLSITLLAQEWGFKEKRSRKHLAFTSSLNISEDVFSIPPAHMHFRPESWQEPTMQFVSGLSNMQFFDIFLCHITSCINEVYIVQRSCAHKSLHTNKYWWVFRSYFTWVLPLPIIINYCYTCRIFTFINQWLNTTYLL